MTWDFKVEIDVSGPDGQHCPFDFFDPGVKLAFQQQVSDLMHDWESYKSDNTLYDEAALVCPGCLVHTSQ